MFSYFFLGVVLLLLGLHHHQPGAPVGIPVQLNVLQDLQVDHLQHLQEGFPVGHLTNKKNKLSFPLLLLHLSQNLRSQNAYLAKVNGGDVLEQWLGVLEQHRPSLLKGLRKVDPAARLQQGEHVAQGLGGIRHQHEGAAEVGGVKPRLGKIIDGLVDHLEYSNGKKRESAVSSQIQSS